MTNDYDTIIIGSGVSGMTAGIILAREGEKVLILEQHKIPGGLMQTYTRNSAVFPTGVHRLGSLKKGQPLWYYFKYLDVLQHLDLVEMNKDAYEHFLFPGQSFQIPNNHNNYREKLKEYFPNEASSIDQYVSDLKNVISSINFYNPSVTPLKDNTLKYTGSLDHYLKSLNISEKLKNVLTANNPLYGLSSDLCPMLTHFLISDSYLNSSFRVNEEKTPLAKAFSKSFISRGGKISVNSKVVSVITKNLQSKGVILDNKEKIFSTRVIFTGHPTSLLDICPPDLFRPVYRKRLRNCENTAGFFGTAMTWKKRSCPVTDSDAFIYDSWDSNGPYKDHDLLNKNPPALVFLSALPAANKDGNISVTALIKLSDSENKLLFQYRKESLNNKYKKAKIKLSQSAFDFLSARWPEIKKDAEIIDTYTPATFERYTLTPKGSAYGIKKSSSNFMQNMFHSATKVKNLFLAGQSIAFSGIHGALVSSVILCSGILGKDYLMKKIVNI